jgi:Zn finger protein HypA/HybF involved in hydrogenase expression
LPKITLPEGCQGLEMTDGTRYNRNRQGHTEVSAEHADVINKSWYRETGVMTGNERVALGTRSGRTCHTCVPTRRWNAWQLICPRCESETTQD